MVRPIGSLDLIRRSPQALPPDARGAPPDFVCLWDRDGRESSWIRVFGELDLYTAPRLEQMIREAVSWTQLVVVDLRGVSFMDSCGVHLLVDETNNARRVDGRLIIVRGPARVDRLFSLTGLTDSVEIYDLHADEPAVQVLLQVAQTTAPQMTSAQPPLAPAAA